MKEATPLVDPVTGHLTAMRRYDNDGVAPSSALMRPRPEDNAPASTVVVNLRSITSSSTSTMKLQLPASVPSLPSLPTSSLHSDVIAPVIATLPLIPNIVSSSVTIIPATVTSTIVTPMQSTASEVARLPSATVVTPVPAKAATGLSYPAVPLTRDAPPPLGLILQQQHQQQQQQQQQPQQQAIPSTQAAQQQQQLHQLQQHGSSAHQLPLPAGVPVSLSGGATVIAVASNGRVSGGGPPPLVPRQSPGKRTHFNALDLIQFNWTCFCFFFN